MGIGVRRVCELGLRHVLRLGLELGLGLGLALPVPLRLPEPRRLSLGIHTKAAGTET